MPDQADWAVDTPIEAYRTTPTLPTIPAIHPRSSSSSTTQGTTDRKDDPLGLVVLYAPPQRTVDVIFIHGLGGTSLRTWCRDRDANNLWPKLWLPEELPTARVLSFGYDAHFASRKGRASSTISDFAADLLFRMKYGENTPERLGQVPIIVVAHSMGGLVFKKAVVQGHLNSEFGEIISMIKAVIFLATPHHGTDLADTLNKALSGSIFGHSPKNYVTELARRSPTIDELDEAFRHHAPSLRIFSFYETLTTSVGPFSVMIVDKLNAIMGYPNETTAPLSADHHGVCKFINTGDPNYISVLGALRSAVRFVLSPTDKSSSREELQQLVTLLGAAGAPEEDLSFGRSAGTQNTCKGFLESRTVDDWLHSELPRVLWAHAQPGAGKSTLCSLVIERLIDAGHHCSYFFFKHGQRNKQSTRSFLLSVAYQTALQLPSFCKALVRLARSGATLSETDPITLWERIFASVLAEIRTDKRIYWVLDGLDEAEDYSTVVELISRVANFKSKIYVLVFSRPLLDIKQAFQLARQEVDVDVTDLPDNTNDIRLMVTEEMGYLLGGDDFKTEVVNEIVSRSQGSFLWASLVTANVVKCHRVQQVRQVLDSTPDGMQDVYDRMTMAVLSHELREDKTLAKVLLTWAMYSRIPVTMEQLLEIYPEDLGPIINLSHAVGELCGQFVVVNPQGRVTLVHHSAREYLAKTMRLPLSLNAEQANEDIFEKCLETLCDIGLRRKLQRLEVPHFLPYAAITWPAHLQDCSPESDFVLESLVRFFNGPYPLAWIRYLAMSGRLSELVSASRGLTVFLRRRKQADTGKSPGFHRPVDLSLIEAWAIDMMKLPSRFGNQLSQCPSAIYQYIPALTPTSSIIHQKFVNNPAATLSVSGISYEKWDDCIARLSGGPGRAERFASSQTYLAVVNNDLKGTITIWDTKVFEEQKSFCLGQYVSAISFNKTGSLLACYSTSQTFVWKVADWTLQTSVDNQRLEGVLEFRFDENDALVIITAYREFYRLPVRAMQGPPAWEAQDRQLLDDPFAQISSVAFSDDCSLVAVSYAHFPVSIWSIYPPRIIARLKNKPGHAPRPMASFTGTSKVVWHPSGTQVICLYGKAFKWGFEDDTYEEAKHRLGDIPHGLACSPNGQFFMTMISTGSIMIYHFSSMSLVYQLDIRGSTIAMGFSLDSLRFYDLKGLYCSVWEPSCLLDLGSEQTAETETASDDFWSDAEDNPNTSISIPTSASHTISKPTITAVEPVYAAHKLLVAHGNYDGSINVYDTLGNMNHEIGKIDTKMRVKKFAWSRKHNRLAYSLDSGATTVMEIKILADNSGKRSVVTQKLYSDKKWSTDRWWTRRLLFHHTGNLLLISGKKKCQVINVPDGAVLGEQAFEFTYDDQPIDWEEHPLDSERLIRFASSSVTAFSWERLDEKISIPLDLTNATVRAENGEGQPAVSIHSILDNYCRKYLLLRTFTTVRRSPQYSFAILPGKEVYSRTAADPSPAQPGPVDQQAPSIKSIVIPESLTSMITHPLGILRDGLLVFFDRQLWLCTTTLPHPTFPSDDPGPAEMVTQEFKPDVKRHFFIPQDWVTEEGLRMCRVLEDGTVLCPSKGEVAILKGGLVEDSWV